MRQGPNGRRPRGRPNRKQHGGPQRPNSFDSSGPEGRIRGNAHQVYEKYVALARDAMSAGDRVAAEAYYQHAEHYFRIVNQSTDPETADRRQPRPEGRPEARDGNGAEINGRGDEGHGSGEGYQAEPDRMEQRRPDRPRPERPQGGHAHADRDANGGSRGEGLSQQGDQNPGQRQQGRRPDAGDAGNGAQAQPITRGGEDDREGLDRVLGQDNNAGPRRRPRQRPHRAQDESVERDRPSNRESSAPENRADAPQQPSSGQAEGEPGDNKPDNEPVGV
jgi:hypothetical protein